MFGVSVARIFGHPFGEIQRRRHTKDLVSWFACSRHGHLHRFTPLGARPSRTPCRWSFGLLVLPWHHAHFLIHDGVSIEVFLVQDEVGKMERQRSQVDFPHRRRSCGGRLPPSGLAFRDGALCFAVGILRKENGMNWDSLREWQFTCFTCGGL